jgi:molybdenum cofactor synthesis domain-containing protein
MQKAIVVTIGTEITSGEIVNTNAAWISSRLEEHGMRVLSHLTVRDRREEILKILDQARESDWLIITGGLGPTSDDLTRACVAEHLRQPLDFNDEVWRELTEVYRRRGLPLREAHRHQCYFPRQAILLRNIVGTAHGFSVGERQRIFVLPGPPRELEAMWEAHIEPELAGISKTQIRRWVRWTCLGAPESEIAELVEAVIAGQDIEVGYRAQVPYVKVKVYIDPLKQTSLIAALEAAMAAYIVARGEEDLAVELLKRWPHDRLVLHDEVTDLALAQRLFTAYRELNTESPRIAFANFPSVGESDSQYGIRLSLQDEEARVRICFAVNDGQVAADHEESIRLPYRIPMNSERGKRSVAEWALWHALRALSAHSSTSK